MRLFASALLLVFSWTLIFAQEGEKYEFQAEVSRLMDIIINSLYAKKEVFLRELLSNASDALDRIRYLAVKDEKQLGEGENRELEIRISFDKAARTLTLRDRGIGMTKQDLINNLGTVAKSGTTQFVEAMTGGQGDLSMIGQFGVGFYSVYLAADRVVVASKHNDDPDQWIWTSSANSTFTIAKDPEGNTLGRGTSITLHLKEDADEYMDQARLEEIIKKYSEFISYPIFLRKSKVEQVEDEAEPEEGEEKKTKAVTTWEWARVNDQPALWTRSKEDITDEEYKQFYKAITKDWSDPLTWTHFKAEGEIEFKSILYVPKVAPPGLYENYYGKSGSLKLYVRRVMISDEFEDLMPRYLNFIRGVVDSDDLPLNVSREQLQQLRILKVIGKKLVRKILEMLKALSDEDNEMRRLQKGEPKQGEEEEGSPFATLWKNFAKSFKLGVIEDGPNRARIVKMCRFVTTAREVTTLEEYVARMPAWQSNIFYITGDNLAEMRKSPFLERAKAKGVEVILLAEAIDEYLVQSLPDFEGKKLQNLAKEGVKFGDESGDDKRREAHYKEVFAGLCGWMKGVLGDAVDKVVVSPRVVDSPAIIVTSQFGHTANMERILKSQTMNDPDKAKYMQAKKTLEINPRHPIIAELAKLNSDDAQAHDMVWILFETARLHSGFDIQSPQEFGARMLRVLKSGLSLKSLDLLPEVDLPPAADKGEEESGGINLDEL